MKHVLLTFMTIAYGSLLLCPIASLCAEQSNQPISAEIEARITDGLQKIAKKYILLQYEKEDVKASVESYNLKSGYKSAHNNNEIYAHIKEVGYGAIPSIAEMMSYGNPETRRKAIIIMATFLPPWWEKPANFADIQTALVPLYVRSAMDTDGEVRISAVCGMEAVGRKYASKKIPDEIVSTLKNLAQNDPDPKVRWAAQDSRITLGLAPRDAEHQWIE